MNVKRCVVSVACGISLCRLFLPPAPAAGQVVTAGIAGDVRDATGAVLPGVTVDAASPALIEKVRSTAHRRSGHVQHCGPAAWHVYQTHKTRIILYGSGMSNSGVRAERFGDSTGEQRGVADV